MKKIKGELPASFHKLLNYIRSLRREIDYKGVASLLSCSERYAQDILKVLHIHHKLLFISRWEITLAAPRPIYKIRQGNEIDAVRPNKSLAKKGHPADEDRVRDIQLNRPGYPTYGIWGI